MNNSTSYLLGRWMLRSVKNEIWAVAAFAVGLVSIFILWWPTILHLGNIMWAVDSYSHGLFVPVISLYLIWDRRHTLSFSACQPYLPGLILLLAAILVWRVGRAAEVMLFTHVALITAINGLVLASFGRKIYRAILFPVLFLYLAVPVGESFIPILQVITAKIAIAGLGLFGVEYSVDGVIITLSSGVFEVARACAGIKFLFTSLVTGVLLAHLAYQGWRKRITLVLFAILLPVFANAARVIGILLIAEYVDADFAGSVDHIVYGWGFLSIILIILIAVAYRFADEALPAKAKPNLVTASEKNTSVHYMAVIILPFVGLYISTAGLENRGSNTWAVEAPARLTCEECAIRPLFNAGAEAEPFYKKADGYFSHKYRSTDQIFTVRGALYCAQAVGQRINQPENRYGPSGWQQVTGAGGNKVTIGDWELERRSYYKGAMRLEVYIAYSIDGTPVASNLEVQVKTAWARFWNGYSTGSVISFSGMPAKNAEQLERSRKKMNEFLSTFPRKSFEWLVINNGNKKNQCVA